MIFRTGHARPAARSAGASTPTSKPDTQYDFAGALGNPHDFYDLADVQARLEAFQDHYNFAARPFNWTYTTKDLNELLKRLNVHSDQPLPAAA